MIHAAEQKSKWLAHKEVLDILRLFDSSQNLVVSTTWLDVDDSVWPHIDTWLQQDERNKVIIIALFDPDWCYLNTKYSNHPRVIKLIPNDYVFWLGNTNKHFIKYTKEDVCPKNFSNKFLCYQRKAYSPRIDLYNKLKDKTGIITLGSIQYEFNNINDIPYHSGFKDIGWVTKVFNENLNRYEYHTPPDILEDNKTCVIPNDIYSLGNLHIWNTSFLNIVSETIIGPTFNQNELFLSEKPFKPILGMRPFIMYGHPNNIAKIKELGFETFDEDFGYIMGDNYESQVQAISEVVDNIDNPELLYKKLLPKITHNFENFKLIAEKEEKKLELLVEQYK